MYLTIDSGFRPFTYEELVKPLQDYTEAYNKVEEQYSTLAQQTEAWKNIATQENSPEAYAMYKKYSDELNAVVSDFSRGMTAQNRSKLAGLKARYASEITPIANAYNAMQEANKYRETIRAKDGSAVFVKDRYNSIDDFLGGQQADNTFISGDEIQKNVTARVLSQSYTDYNNLINAGMNPDRAVQIVASGNNQSIADIIAEEQNSLGIESFDTQGQAKLNNAILSGVQQGLGSFASKEYMSRAERDASARGWANLEESKKQHGINLEMHGYNKDGTINPNSPYWSMNGIKWKSDKDGTLVPEAGVKPKGSSEEKTSVEDYQKGTVITKNGIENTEEWKKKNPSAVASSYIEFDDLDNVAKTWIETYYPDMTLEHRRTKRYLVYKNSKGEITSVLAENKTISNQNITASKDISDISFSTKD